MAEYNEQSLLDIYNSVGSGSEVSSNRGFTTGELTRLYSMPTTKEAEYLEQQTKADNDYKIGKAFYNGFVVQTAQGLQGLGQMIIDRRAEDLKGKGYDVPTDITDHAMETSKDSAWNSVLERYNVKGETRLGQFGLDVVEGAGQLGAQALVTYLSGGTAGSIFMGTQIGGKQYTELRNKGISSDRATIAAGANAVVQGYLEKLGLGPIFKNLPAGSSARKKIINILESFFSEGLTEGIQEFPEQFTNIWATNEGKSLREMAAQWDANASENLKAAGYSAIIGGILGGGSSSAKVLLNNAVDYAANKYHDHLVTQVDNRIEGHKKSGMDADTVAQTVNANLPNSYVEIPGDVLQSYMQEKNPAEVAERLGTTVEEIEAAAEIGGDVTIRQGDYEATAVANEGFADAMREHISFGSADTSINNVALRRELRKAYDDLSQKTRMELDNEVNNILDSARKAGVAESQISGLGTLLTSRAMIVNPENPAQFFKDNPLEFNNAGNVDSAKGLYKQAAFIKEYNGISDFEKAINEDKKADANALSYKYKSSNGGAFEILGGNYKHVQDNQHSLSHAEWDAVLSSIDNVDNILDAVVTEEKGSHNGIIVKQKINTPVGIAVAITEYTANGRVFVVTVGMDGKNGINADNWMKKNKRPQTLEHSLLENERRMGQTSYTNIVKNKLGIVKNYYTQESLDNTKGAIQWDEDGKAIINLFKGADASTVIHETGHYFVEAFMKESALENADPKLKKDRAALLEYVGMTEEQWNNADFEGRRAAHEKLAEGFETYIIEGKAPTKELRSVFRRFSNWLKAVYSSIINEETKEKAYDPSKRNANAIELTPEVRAVFDRMLATEEEIKATERIDGYFAGLPKIMTDNLNQKYQDKMKDYVAVAHDKAVDILTQKAMANFSAERREAIKNYRKEIRSQAEADVFQKNLYTATFTLESMFPGKSIRTMALKTQYTAGVQWTNWAQAKQDADKAVYERVGVIQEQMWNDLKSYNPHEIWVDLDTGERDVDVSDLEAKNAEELLTNDHYRKEWDIGTDAKDKAWLSQYFEEQLAAGHPKRKPTKAELFKIAYDIYVGNDAYGFYQGETLGMSQEEGAAYEEDMAAKKDEIDFWLDVQAEVNKQGEWYKNGFRKWVLTPDERVAWDSIAEENGYDSGDAMAKDILNSPTFKQAVNARVQEYVDQKFPDVMAERKQAEQAAREALYNDETGKVIALEEQLIYDELIKAENQSLSEESKKALMKARLEATKQAAKAELSRMPLAKALKHGNFAKAERRAAAMAAKAIKAGNMEEAMAYKEKQLLLHEMVKESLRMRQYVARAKNNIRRQRKAKKETWGTEIHFNQTCALLERMGMGRKDYNAESRTQSLADYVAAQQNAGSMVDIAAWLLDETIDISNPSELTIQQYKDVIDALKNIKAVAVAERKQRKIDEENTFQDLKGNILENLGKLATKFTAEVGGREKAGWVEKYIASLRNTDNLFELMDGWSYGYFSKTFGTPLKAAADMEARMTMAMQARLEQAYTEWLDSKEARQQAAEKVYYEELGTSLDKFTLVQMLANMGNESSLRVLCGTAPIGISENNSVWVKADGENISEEQAIELTKTNLINFMQKYVTAKDIQYAQKLIDNANAYWEELAQVNRNTKGFTPMRVEARSMAFTLANGEVVFFKGGYFPLVRDGRHGSAPAGRAPISDTDPNANRNTAALHTFTGSSKARVKASYPIALHRGAELKMLEDTIHDIAYREVMADFRKIIKDQDINAMLKAKLGLATNQQFVEMLEKAANPYNNSGMVQAESWFANTAGWLRTKTVNAAIMLNLKTSFQNLGNIFLYGRAIEGFGYNDVVAAMGRWGLQGLNAKGETELNAICSKSVFMQERILFPDISVREIVGQEDLNKVEKATLKWGAMMLAYTDNITAKPMWAQAYSKKINEGASEQEAIDFADAIIRRTLGSSRVQDVSSMMRGGPIYKLFTTFQGFFNTQFNQWEREANIDINKWQEGERAEAVMRMSAFVASKWLFACLANLWLCLENPLDDEDKGFMNSNIVKECMQYPLSMGGPVGQAGVMMVNNLMGYRSYGYRMAVIQSTIDKGFKLGRTTRQFMDGSVDLQSMIEATTGVAGVALGVPDQLNKLFWNAWDVLYNGMDVAPQDLMKRRPKRER